MAAIKVAAQEAVVAGQTAVVLPSTANAAIPMTASAAGRMKDAGRGELAKHFTGRELARRQDVLNNFVDEQTTGDVRILAAGVRELDILSVTVSDGTHATVSGQAVEWRDIAQVQSDGRLLVAHPSSTMLFTLQLELTDGTWLVANESETFAPGSEP